MSEEEGILVSVPYYSAEFLMPWDIYHEVPLSTFVEDAINKARMSVVTPRFEYLLRGPELSLYIGGRPPASMDTSVYMLLAPDDLVMLLTAAEAQELFPDARGFSYTPIVDRNSFLPPLFRRDPAEEAITSQRLAAGLLLRMVAAELQDAERPTDEERDQSALQRLNARYASLITNSRSNLRGRVPPVGVAPAISPMRFTTREQRADPEVGDEEIVETSMIPTQQDRIHQQVMESLTLMTGLLGLAQRQDPPVGTMMPPGNVKKVINTDTFLRVCPVVPVVPFVAKTDDVEENDTIGGDQDGGLGGCGVCLSLLVNLTKPSGELRKMPDCSHIFHADCLSQWLTKNSITCPVCRKPAVTETKDYGYLGYGSDEDAYTPAEPLTTAQSMPAWVPVFPPPARRR